MQSVHPNRPTLRLYQCDVQLLLIPTEPLQPQSADTPAIPLLDALKKSRQDYQRLLLEKMRAPDGGYEEGFVIPGTGKSPARTTRVDKNLETNNPLSLHDDVRLSGLDNLKPSIKACHLRTLGRLGLPRWTCERRYCRTLKGREYSLDTY